MPGVAKRRRWRSGNAALGGSGCLRTGARWVYATEVCLPTGRSCRLFSDPQVVGADKATVLRLLALEPGRYPSPKMFLLRMGAAGANSQRAATAGAARPARVGKPSMFYLIAFPDNVYVAENRDHGLTAGNEPELQALDMPVAGFLGEHPMVKS